MRSEPVHQFEIEEGPPGTGGSGGRRSQQQRWLVLFRQFDADNDGLIPLGDLRGRLELAGETYGITPHQQQILLADADKNFDKFIDFAEFCHLMSKAKHMRMRQVMFRAAQMVLPKSEREEPFSYIQQYNCMPPPIFLIAITLVQVILYIYYVAFDEKGTGISISGPTPVGSPLIYNPHRRREAWRLLTYMFIHIGIYHITFNSLTQLLLGIPLELVHKFWRVGLVYLAGVVAGALTVTVTDPQVYLAGASGGVYALIAAHLANLIVNWKEMEFAIVRLIFAIILIGTDVGVAIYNRLTMDKESTSVSYAAHLGGFVAGLLMGIVVLRNFKKKTWEKVVWWVALIGFIILAILCVIWNIAEKTSFPDQDFS